jgi:hypothetical protein
MATSHISELPFFDVQLATCYTVVPNYTARYCTRVVLGCTVAVHYCNIVAQYYTVDGKCCMGLGLDCNVVMLAQSSFRHVPYMHLMLFPALAP